MIPCNRINFVMKSMQLFSGLHVLVIDLCKGGHTRCFLSKFYDFWEIIGALKR